MGKQLPYAILHTTLQPTKRRVVLCCCRHVIVVRTHAKLACAVTCVWSLDSAACVSSLRLLPLCSRHTPKLARLARMNRTRLALPWFSKAACTVRAPGVRSRRPPRLAYLAFSLASTAHQGLGLASSRRFGLCGAVLGFAPVWGWTHGHAPGVPLRLMPVGFASGLWRPAFVLFLFSLPFVFLRGGKRTTRTTIPPQVGPFRRKAMRPRLDLPLAAG